MTAIERAYRLNHGATLLFEADQVMNVGQFRKLGLESRA